MDMRSNSNKNSFKNNLTLFVYLFQNSFFLLFSKKFLVMKIKKQKK